MCPSDSKRCTAGTDGALTTDSNATHCTRALGVGDIHTGCLTLHTLEGILDGHGGQFLGVQVCQGTGDITLVLNAITYDNDLIQGLVAILQRNGDNR